MTPLALAVAFLLAATACHSPADTASSSSAATIPTSTVQHASASITFERTLEIAASGSPDAFATLESIRDSTPDEQIRRLTLEILRRWSGQHNKFSVSSPVPLFNTCLDVEALKSLYPETTNAGLLYARILVDRQGRPLRIEFLRGIQDERLREAIREYVSSSRFLPAKVDDDGYEEAEAIVECRLEVK